jgi:hypothetical protein
MDVPIFELARIHNDDKLVPPTVPAAKRKALNRKRHKAIDLMYEIRRSVTTVFYVDNNGIAHCTTRPQHSA